MGLRLADYNSVIVRLPQPFVIDKIAGGPNRWLPRLDEPEFIMLLYGGVDNFQL
jgi:hypothetical protein